MTERDYIKRGVGLLAGTAMVAVAMAAVPAGFGFGPGQAVAQEEEQRSERQTRRVQSASRPVYEALTEAQELMELEDYQGAIAKAQELAEDMEDLSSYERVLVNQMFGYIYSSQENYDRAISYFEAMIAEEDIPVGLRDSTLYNLGQLYLIEEEYRKSINTLNRWFEVAQNPGPNAYMLLAQAYMQIEDYKSALEPALTGMQVAKENLARDRKLAAEDPEMEMPDPIRESWFQIVLSLRFQLQQYDEAIGVLRELLQLYPKRDYWLQMAAAFYETGREWDQLGAMEAAYRQDLLIRSSELENLAQLYMFHGIPIKGAWVIEDGMERDVVEKDDDSWQLLANAYYNAQEAEKSIEPLRNAARLSDDGDLYVRLGQSLMDLARWEEATEAFSNAIDKGDLDSPGQAHLLRGMSHFNADNFQDARTAFRSARDHGETRQSAVQWLNYLAKEEERRSLDN